MQLKFKSQLMFYCKSSKSLFIYISNSQLGIYILSNYFEIFSERPGFTDKVICMDNMDLSSICILCTESESEATGFQPGGDEIFKEQNF